MFERTNLLLLTVGRLLIGAGCSSGNNEAHYAEVEKHRQEQAAQSSPATAPATAASPSPQASVAASPQQARPAVPAPPKQATAAAPGRNYWTNFRGPKRAGKYDEAPVSTSWPANGLPVI